MTQNQELLPSLRRCSWLKALPLFRVERIRNQGPKLILSGKKQPRSLAPVPGRSTAARSLSVQVHVHLRLRDWPMVPVPQLTPARGVLEQVEWLSRGAPGSAFGQQPQGHRSHRGSDKPGSHQVSSATPAQRRLSPALSPPPPRCSQGVRHPTHLSPWTLPFPDHHPCHLQH